MTSFRRLCSLSLALSLSTAIELQAKGLDTLQAETPEAAPSGEKAGSEAPAPTTPVPAAIAPSTPPPPVNPALPGVPPTVEAAKAGAPVSAPLPPGLQKTYLASSLSWVHLSKSNGGWHSGTTGDIEIGQKITQFSDKQNLFGTFRYRPIAASVVSGQRSYRAAVESYLAGVKSHYALNSKLTAFGSLEVGLVKTHVVSIDALTASDPSLEKSGVDLSLGGGVSYLVLDKLGVGSRLAFGSGTYKTLQLGLDLRFLF